MTKSYQILLFITGITGFAYISRGYWQSWIPGFLSFVFILSVILIGFVIFLENRHPTKTITWLVVLGAFPVFGFIFYILFGQSYRKKRLFRKKAIQDVEVLQKVEGNSDGKKELIKEIGGNEPLLFNLVQRVGENPISFHTETRVLTNGEATFASIIDMLEQAKHHIHLEYYIVRNDTIGNQIKQLLIKKAISGVTVRFLYDAVGSWRLSQSYIKDLRNAGVEMVSFSPVKFPVVNHKINFRNHRKIIIIDGTIAFVGGLNIGDEYLGRNPYFGFWRDTHLLVKGEAVRSLQLIFLQDWYYMTGETLLNSKYLNPIQPAEIGRGGVQMLAGGPDQRWEVIKDVFFAMIISAKKSIWIATPYFIPDVDILSALKIAALSGVDVKIILPNRPDKKFVFHASRSYFLELLEAGVSIYEYSKGFLHCKILIVDQEIASIGTANMDMRSFHLNFEVNAFLYRTSSIETLVQNYEQDVIDSNQIVLETFQQRSLFLKLFESTARLFSPLL